MTRDEILAMEPGRELDALVHQRILGKRCRYIKSEPDDTRIGEGPLGLTSNFGGAVFTSDRDWLVDDWLDEETNRELRHYSETWEGMRLVVEAMGKKGWFVTMNGPDNYDGNWFARFRSRTLVENAIGEEAPEAACKAALLALGVNREE